MAGRKLKIKLIGGEHGLRYHVESRSDPDHPHLVDLSSFKGYGQCSCKNWCCNVWPIVRDQTQPKRTPKSTCAHIRVALKYLLNLTLNSLINEYAPDEATEEEEAHEG